MTLRRLVRLRTRRILVALLCLAGGTVWMQTAGRGLDLPLAGAMALGATVGCCRWALSRRRQMRQCTTPPWQATTPLAARVQRQPETALRSARHQLLNARLRARLLPLPGQPRPAAPRRTRLGRRVGAQVWRAILRAPRVRLPMPTIDVQFVMPERADAAVIDAHQAQTRAADLVTRLLAQHCTTPPELLALHDEARQVVCQLAPTPLLTAVQQREIARALQEHGQEGRWTDLTLLALRRETPGASRSELPERQTQRLWLPAVRTRSGTIWWPLARTQHLALAGAAHGPLAGLIARRERLAAARRPLLLIDDPDGRLREWGDTLAALRPQEDALARARHAQLAWRFARERGLANAALPPPLLLVVAPSAARWPDLQPLLAPDSGAQVVIILGDRTPIGELRAVCHRLPVIEIPDLRFPALPDAFRPAGLPAVGPGQAIAWLAGGQVVWRGLPPAVDDARASALEEERPR